LDLSVSNITKLEAVLEATLEPITTDFRIEKQNRKETLSNRRERKLKAIL